MSSSIADSKQSSSSSVVLLVKGPECHQQEDEQGVMSVVAGHCQPVELTDSPAPQKPSLALQPKATLALQVPVIWQSLFRGGGSNNNTDDDDDDKQFQQEQEQEGRELVEHDPTTTTRTYGTKASSHLGAADVSNDNDAETKPDLTREYGYKYEFSDSYCDNTKNNNQQEEEDGNCCQSRQGEEDNYNGEDEDDDDGDGQSESLLDEATYDPLLPMGNTNISSSISNGVRSSLHAPGGPCIHLLGKSYDPDLEYDRKRDDELSLFWFTYRCDFPEIVPYRITSDAGWGCMLRSAQMMLGQALRVHFKSRDWKSHRLSIAQRRRETFLRSLLTWMADFPSSQDSNYYSLHNMVAAGMAKHEILPGEWYGPGSACYVLRDLVHAHETRIMAIWKRRQQQQLRQAEEEEQQKTSDSDEAPKKPTAYVSTKPVRVFRVYVAPQGTVYHDAIRELMTKESRAQYEETKQQAQSAKGPKDVPEHPLETAAEDLKEEQQEKVELEQLTWDTGLLLLIPLRLGLNGINEGYAKSIANSFAIPQSVGVLGGRPRGARWFYGAWEDGSKILGLDPHTVQNAPRRRNAKVNGKVTSVVDISEAYLRSIHTTNQETVPMLRMDPSIALGFYCRTPQDLQQIQDLMTRWKAANSDLPELFTFAKHSPDYANGGDPMMDDLMAGDMTGSSFLEDDGDNSGESDEDEYVML